MSIPSSGSSTWRSASTTSSCVGMQLRLAQPHFLATIPREEVDPVDEPHPVAARAHDQGMRARRVGEEANAAQEVAVGYARGRDDHLTGRQLLRREDARGIVDPGLASQLDLPARGRPELRL